MKGAKSKGAAKAETKDEFRKEFKEKNPKNKSVAAVGKAAGERWKSLSESDSSSWLFGGRGVCSGGSLQGNFERSLCRCDPWSGDCNR
ncbi:DNA-binding protein MNB1B-like [Lolium perenne]|uniref:DNA-binding protein MNB1B-like n=1 Tax=Lolium perenne TaxID=4522 RepID=UPI0021F62C40|nr:DNA-binding protein MNB1B-like [Lolium perenne]